MENSQLFELRRRTFDTPHFSGMEFIEVEAKTIINKVPGNGLPFDYTINPYRGCSHGCTSCFARPTHTYLDMNAGKDFETKIVVKVNAPEKLRFELGKRSWRGGAIAMGTNTDPYQRVEGRYQLMRGILQALIDYRNPFSILSRSPLMLRDLDLLLDAAKVTDVSTAFSVPTIDEHIWRLTEPGAPNPKKRLDAVRTLNEAGIPCGVMLAPILPGISDRPAQIKEVIERAIDAGATFVTPILLHLRPGVREEYMGWLSDEFPELVKSYEEMYEHNAYGPKAGRVALQQQVRSNIAAAGGLRLRTKPKPNQRWNAPKPPKPKQPSQLKLL